MTLTARPGLAILFVVLAALALSLSSPPAQAQDGSVPDQDEEPDVSYVTVVVDRTPEPSVAQFTVTWNDAHEGKCSTQYNAYLVDYFVDTESVHLGSATSDDVQIVKSVDSSGMNGGLGYRVNLFCGDTDDYRFVSWIRLPSGLPSGTYSSEPALIGLVVDSGSLEPAFHQYKFSYVVDDVPASDDRITVTATAKDEYYGIVFVEGHVHYVGQGCGGTECLFNYSTESREKLGTLEDVDTVTPGFQLDLEQGQTDFSIHVHPLVDGGNVYQFSVTSSEDEPSLRSYITVVVAEDTSDPDNPQTDFTITWSDVDTCSTGYNAYLSEWTYPNGRDRTHLGSAATDGSQITSSLSNVEGEGINFGVELYCGTEDSGRLVSSVSIPRDDGRLVPSTYSSEPPLTALTVSPGTLTPTFHSHTLDYTVADVVSDDVRLTLVATAKPDYRVVFVKHDAWGVAIICDPFGFSCGEWHYQDGDGNPVYPLTDANPNETGFQVDLAVGEKLVMHMIREYRGVPLENQFYVLMVTRAANAPANTLATGAPTISGAAQVGETLTASTSGIADADGLSGATFSYQWLSSRDTEIQGATGAAYILVPGDEGKTVKVRVTFTDDEGNAETLTSEPTDAVSAAPPPPPDNVRAVTQESGAVELNWDAPLGATVTGYRIDRRRADQQGSVGRPRDNHTLVEDTGSADTGYTDKSAEKGVEYEYRVSARNEAGPGEGSDWVRAGPASASNNPATGAPTISGTAQVGETLTAGITGIADADGLSGETFTYQWVSSDGTTDTDIEKATDSTYKLVDADQGKAIKVRVTFTDDGGNEETLTSAPTEPVLGDGPPGAPRNLTATPGNKEVTLSWEPPADNGNPPATRYRIEWRVDGKDYDKNDWGTARSTTYTTNDQANLANGVKYFFRVRAENGSGNSYGPYGPASEELSATPTSGSAVDLGTPVLSNTENLHHRMVQLDWEDIEDAGWYVVQYYHLEGGEWLDLPAAGVEITFHGSSAVVSNLRGLSWLRVGAASCDGASEWSQIEELYGTNASDWEGVPVPEVEEGDEIEPCPVVLGTPVLSDTEDLHHGMVQLDWQDIEDAGWYVVQYYHLEGGEWLDLPAAGVEITFHGSSAVVSNLHGLSWLRVGAASCDGASEWSQIEELYGTNASDWKGVPVPEVEEGDEIEPCSEDADTPDNSPATGAPTISGTAQVGETLTANTSGVIDADGLSNVQYEYQWLADDADISGATNATYTLVAADEGKAVKVQVSFTDDADNEETLTSAATATVAAATQTNSPATGAPTISGTAQVGETLTANTSGIADADGLGNVQYEYQWLADDADISGATNATYTLADADEGKAITVRVSFTDDEGNEETLTSAATDAVAAASTPNSPATGAPAIGGTAQVGETLTADTSGIADEDGLSNVQYEYQWLADDSEITGATDLTYTLADIDEGKAITVRVSFTDDADNGETLTSAATGAVAGAQPTEPPAKPRNLSATATHDSVTLTWDDPGDDSITGYVILRRIPGDDPEGHFDVLVADTGTAATTYTDGTVSAETRYTYRIKAISGARTSERSCWVHIDVPAAPVPDKPTGLEATVTHGQVTLTWDDPGDDSITGYVILRRVRENNTGGDFSVLVADTGTAALTYTDAAVVAGTTYTYRIKAINEHGTSERSRWYHIDIPEAP